jgi:hypothetical protein
MPPERAVFQQGKRCMRIKLYTLLRYQLVFYLLAIGYLVMSYFSMSRGEPALSAADPVTSGIFLSIYCVFCLRVF